MRIWAQAEEEQIAEGEEAKSLVKLRNRVSSVPKPPRRTRSRRLGRKDKDFCRGVLVEVEEGVEGGCCWGWGRSDGLDVVIDTYFGLDFIEVVIGRSSGVVGEAGRRVQGIP